MEQISSHEHWIDIRLSQEEIVFLNNAIITEEQRNNNNENYKETTTGIVSRCDLIDKDNWFYENVLKKLTEKMFCQDWNVYKKYFIDKEEPLPKFEMTEFWVNYMKQYDIVPIHNHPSYYIRNRIPLPPSGLTSYSFVIFMKIPTHWEEQKRYSKNLNCFISMPAANFQFIFSEKNSEEIKIYTINLSPEDGGRMLFFPSELMHQVSPFYECEEERISISGNVQPQTILQEPVINKTTREGHEPPSVEVMIEEKEHTLEILQNNVQHIEEDLKQMKLNQKKTEKTINL